MSGSLLLIITIIIMIKNFNPAATAARKNATPSVVSGHVNLSGSNVQTLALIAFVGIGTVKQFVDKATHKEGGA